MRYFTFFFCGAPLEIGILFTLRTRLFAYSMHFGHIKRMATVLKGAALDFGNLKSKNQPGWQIGPSHQPSLTVGAGCLDTEQRRILRQHLDSGVLRWISNACHEHGRGCGRACASCLPATVSQACLCSPVAGHGSH